MVVSVRKDLPDEWEPIGGAVAQMMPDLRTTVENQNHELQKGILNVMIGVAFAEVAYRSSKIHTPGDETLSFFDPRSTRKCGSRRRSRPSRTLPRQPRSSMSIQNLGRYGIVLFLAALSSGCSSIIGECGLVRSSCMYDGKYEQGEEDYAEAEAKRLNKQSTDRLRRSSGD